MSSCIGRKCFVLSSMWQKNLINMMKRILHHKGVLITSSFLAMIIFIGIFAPFFAPNDPYEIQLNQKFMNFSLQYPLGTDQLGRCLLSRLIWGIRPTLGFAFLTTIGTIFLGVFFGILAGYGRGLLEECIMRLVDILLSFPNQIIIFAIVTVFGIDMYHIIFANIIVKWAWYARIIRTNVFQYREKNFVSYSKVIGNSHYFIFTKHILPAIMPEILVLASLDIGWAMMHISTLSFLGLGIQAPIPEWGAMLNEAKTVLHTNPKQMLITGIAIILVVMAFQLLGDLLRETFQESKEYPKEKK